MVPKIVTFRQCKVGGGYSAYCYEHQPTYSCATLRFVLMRSQGSPHRRYVSGVLESTPLVVNRQHRVLVGDPLLRYV